MITRVKTTTSLGLSVQPIEVELDISSSLPAIIIVGLADKAVTESKERLRSGIKQSGYEFPMGKITVNLAPADVVKTGSGLDLAIAVGILAHSKVIKKLPSKSIFVGELALDGVVRRVPGVLSVCKWALENGVEQVFIPAENSVEASLIQGLKIIPVSSLRQLVEHLNGDELIDGVLYGELISDYNIEPQVDFRDVKGQAMAKRALEIAAAGGHNILMIGEPGSGKTLLSRAMFGILPPLEQSELLEVLEIYSLVGRIDEGLMQRRRPFRSPHHSSSYVSLVGGGSKLMPGEITLAHRGVLFLDEFPEFNRMTLEALRQPLEEGYVDISRARGSVRYPSKFMLIAAANPTPSGFGHGHASDNSLSYNAIKRYQAKFSGPIIDRIDMYIEVNRPQTHEMMDGIESESSFEIRKRVLAARLLQKKRFQDCGLDILTNSEITAKNIDDICLLSVDAKPILQAAVEKYQMSGRGYHRILKLARTIADLNDHKIIEKSDLMESLQYRSKSFLVQ